MDSQTVTQLVEYQTHTHTHTHTYINIRQLNYLFRLDHCIYLL
jgi:hypothetical protein